MLIPGGAARQRTARVEARSVLGLVLLPVLRTSELAVTRTRQLAIFDSSALSIIGHISLCRRRLPAVGAKVAVV